MFVITFYSFKGGLGRTTALVHIAWLLKEAGKKVLVWDMDLEAPGFVHQPFMRGMKPKNVKTGFVDFVTEYLATAEIPDITAHIAASPAGFDVLLAGGLGDTSYPGKLAAIDWSRLNEEHYGQVVVEHLKAQLRDAGYDYVLVDSKTGFSDVGGFCTLQLPDAAVLVFGLNDQNLAGIQGVYGLIREYNEENPTHLVQVVPVVSPYWPLSSDAVAERMTKAGAIFGGHTLSTVAFDTALAFHETIIFDPEPDVACQAATDYRDLCERVRKLNPDDEPQIREQLQEALARFESGLCELERVGTGAAAEPGGDRREQLADRVFALAVRWVTFELDDLPRLFELRGVALRVGKKKKFRAWLEQLVNEQQGNAAALLMLAMGLDIEDQVEDAQETFARAVQRFPENPQAWGVRASFWVRRKQWENALSDTERAIALDGTNVLYWRIKGNALLELERLDPAIAALTTAAEMRPQNAEVLAALGRALGKAGKHEIALEKFEAALRHDPNSGQTWVWRGDALLMLGRSEDAARSYERAAKLANDNADTWRRWGVALSALAGETADEELWRVACKKFEKATQLDPDMAEAWFHWGVALGELADATGDDDLLREAGEKFARVIDLEPDRGEAWFNWALVLGKLADATGDARLRREQSEKYGEGVRANPEDHTAWNGWAGCLLKLYAVEPSDTLLEEARAKCTRAEELKPGAGAYNLACVEGRSGNMAECLEWLRKAVDHEPDVADHAVVDPDLEAAREDDLFWEIIGRERPADDAEDAD